MTMAGVTFTERELGFIDGCAIDGKGVLVEMPASPFPSLYRKGVIAKRGGALTVAKGFRGMFRPAGQAGGGPGGGGESKYGEAGGVAVGGAPAGYARFRQAVAADLRDRRTKGTDEFRLIDKAVRVYGAAREARAADGGGGTRSERTAAGSRKRWRYGLADTVAAYFGVGMGVDGHEVVFTGDPYMAGAAELVFEYLFKIGNRRAQRCYDERLSAGGPTVGVYAGEAAEFMAEVGRRLRHGGAGAGAGGEAVGGAAVGPDRPEG